MSDLEAAADFMLRQGLGPCAMVGHSLGGTATLIAAVRIPAVRAVVAVAAPFSPDHVRHLFAEHDVARAMAEGSVTVKIAGRPFQISAEFLHDLERHCTPEHLAALGRPLLVVHGTDDRIVGIEEGERIFDAARQPRWFAAIPGANHLFTEQAHAERAAAAIVSFLDTMLRG